MPLRSVDMQVLIPKINEVGRTQQINEHQHQLQQQQAAQEMNKINVHKQQQVQGAPKGEGAKVEREKERQKRDRDKNVAPEKQVTEDDNEKEEVRDPNKGNFVDITV